MALHGILVKCKMNASKAVVVNWQKGGVVVGTL